MDDRLGFGGRVRQPDWISEQRRRFRLRPSVRYLVQYELDRPAPLVTHQRCRGELDRDDTAPTGIERGSLGLHAVRLCHRDYLCGRSRSGRTVGRQRCRHASHQRWRSKLVAGCTTELDSDGWSDFPEFHARLYHRLSHDGGGATGRSTLDQHRRRQVLEGCCRDAGPLSPLCGRLLRSTSWFCRGRQLREVRAATLARPAGQQRRRP